MQSSIWFFIIFAVFCVALGVRNAQKKKNSNVRFANGPKTLNVAGVINKYELEPGVRSTLMLPASAEIITIKAIGDAVFIWVVVPENQVMVKRIFNVLATGESVPENSTYIGTAFPDKLVFHVFEEK